LKYYKHPKTNYRIPSLRRFIQRSNTAHIYSPDRNTTLISGRKNTIRKKKYKGYWKEKLVSMGLEG